MKAVVFGKGYWAAIVMKYIVNAKFDIIGIVDSGTSKEGCDACIVRADVAFVLTPVETHYEICYKLLNHKKHVFCEKILTDNPEQAEKLYKIADQNHVILFTDYTFLYSKGIQALQKNLDSIGKIEAIHASFTQFGKFYPKATVMETIGVHPLSILHLLLGQDITFGDSQCIFKSTVHDTVNIYHMNDITVSLRCSLLSNIKTRSIEVVGSNAILSYNMLDEITWKCQDRSDSAKYKAEHYDEANNLQYVMEAFCESLYDIKRYRKNRNISLSVVYDLYEKGKRNT